MPDERTYGLCNACDNPLAALHYVFALHRYAKCGLQSSMSLTPPQFIADSAATAKRAGDRLYRGIGHDIDKKTGIARSRRYGTISALAEQLDVSRKFVYGQAHKADLALDNVFYPMECENVCSSHPEPKLSLPMDKETDPVFVRVLRVKSPR